MSWWRAILGTGQQRRLARYERWVRAINRLEPGLEALSDHALQERAGALRQRVRDGTAPGRLLVQTFAVVREASRRVLGMRHFDVQLIGGMALHEGHIVEMKTGEGKTLVATLPAVLDGLAGEGVHIVTVNDYLAQRDAEWMGPLYRFLGLEVGVILEGMGVDREEEIAARQAAYACDVTYGTNHEIAFDYLRDNLAVDAGEVVHRGFHQAIIDEVDFLIIDEARTPLIISGPSHEDPGLFDQVDRATRKLQAGYHFAVDPKTRTAALTDAGLEELERALGRGSLADLGNLDLFHAVHQSVLAHGVYRRDVDYIVQRDRVLIVDEFTGRVSEEKRYADGLHQAIEAKERVRVREEDRTLAKVTYQTFFGRYAKLSGMTGTASSERDEFRRTYGREVQVIPTHRPMIRTDYADLVFENIDDKRAAIVEEILDLRAAGRPVLVGSTSVRESEKLSTHLKKEGVPHAVLNAKNHAAEAAIIAQAGAKGAVTISTNMAGRGTDILLGGNAAMIARERELGEAELARLREACARDRAEVVAAGGLHVIGTAHHESVRIDDQLRGRAGRQGDPGSSQFIVCLDDEVYEKFGREDLEEIREQLHAAGHAEGEPISTSWVLRTLRGLQQKVDEENRAIRRDLLKYDLVIHAQRETIYGWRRTLVTGEGYDPTRLVREVVADLCAEAEEGASLASALQACFSAPFSFPAEVRSDLFELAAPQAIAQLHSREAAFGAELLHEVGRLLLLEAIDALWTDHLFALEQLEEGIGLRGYAEVDPVLAWRREATEMWQSLMAQIRRRAVTLWFHVALDGARAGADAQQAPPRPAARRPRPHARRRR